MLPPGPPPPGGCGGPTLPGPISRILFSASFLCVLSHISPDGPLVGVGAEEEVGILELVGGGGWLPLPPGLLLLLGGPPTLFGPLGPPPPLGGPTGVPGPLPCVEPCGLPEPGPEK